MIDVKVLKAKDKEIIYNLLPEITEHLFSVISIHNNKILNDFYTLGELPKLRNFTIRGYLFSVSPKKYTIRKNIARINFSADVSDKDGGFVGKVVVKSKLDAPILDEKEMSAEIKRVEKIEGENMEIFGTVDNHSDFY